MLPKEHNASPRQLQLLVDKLPVEQGLTVIEAPTGSGKTETALAYAWRLLNAELADNIIFALPTQATANAMLKRLEAVATLLFEDQPNLVLAQGYTLIDGDKPIQDLDAWWKDEALNLNTVSVPKSWCKFLPEAKDGLIILPLRDEEDKASGEFKGVSVTYSKDFGLEKRNICE